MAYHTRSRITLTDEYSTTVQAPSIPVKRTITIRPSTDSSTSSTPRPPHRFAAFIMGKAGIVSADYERVDYGTGTERLGLSSQRLRFRFRKRGRRRTVRHIAHRPRRL